MDPKSQEALAGAMAALIVYGAVIWVLSAGIAYLLERRAQRRTRRAS